MKAISTRHIRTPTTPPAAMSAKGRRSRPIMAACGPGCHATHASAEAIAPPAKTERTHHGPHRRSTAGPMQEKRHDVGGEMEARVKRQSGQRLGVRPGVGEQRPVAVPRQGLRPDGERGCRPCRCPCRTPKNCTIQTTKNRTGEQPRHPRSRDGVMQARAGPGATWSGRHNIRAARFHLRILANSKRSSTSGAGRPSQEVGLSPTQERRARNAEISARRDLLVLRETFCNRVGRAGRSSLRPDNRCRRRWKRAPPRKSSRRGHCRCPRRCRSGDSARPCGRRGDTASWKRSDRRRRPASATWCGPCHRLSEARRNGCPWSTVINCPATSQPWSGSSSISAAPWARASSGDQSGCGVHCVWKSSLKFI